MAYLVKKLLGRVEAGFGILLGTVGVEGAANAGLLASGCSSAVLRGLQSTNGCTF